MRAGDTTTLLAEADRTRDKDAAVALGLYERCDVASLCGDAPRVEWILDQLRANSEHQFRDLLQYLGEQPAGTPLRRCALHRMAVFDWYAGKLDAAAELWRAALSDECSVQDRLWAQSCNNLALACRTRGCWFEALVLTGAVARAQGADVGVDLMGYAEAYRSRILLDLGEPELAEVYLKRATTRLSHIRDLAQTQTVEACILAGWAQLYLQTEDRTRALAAIEAERRYADGVEGSPPIGRVMLELQQIISYCELFPERREELLATARELIARHPTCGWLLRWEIELLGIEFLFQWKDRGDLDAAAAAARQQSEKITALEGSMRQARALEVIGCFFTEVVVDAQEARRAFDCAATILLERILELHRVTTEVVEVQDLTDEDRSILHTFEQQLEEQHESLSEAVRQRWHPGQPAFDLIVAGDLVCICAWCRRAHTRDDQWVLLADFRPPNPMRVTHVICDSCRERNFGV